MIKNCLKTFIFIMLLFSINLGTVKDVFSGTSPKSVIDYPIESVEHELIVNWITPPQDLNLRESTIIKVSVTNSGLENESDVQLSLSINDSIVASKTFPLLIAGSMGTLEYEWTPAVEGQYNVTAYSLPVVNETDTANNVVSKIVQVCRVVVCVEPETVTANVNETFTINVKIANVTRLFGFDIQFRWSPITLKYVSHKVKVPKGSTYPDGILYGSPLIIKNMVNESGVSEASPGTLFWLSVVSFGTSLSFNGTGIAFNMTFKVLQKGECDIYFTSVDLSDKKGKSIPHEVRDGYFYMEGLGSVPVANFTCWPSKRVDSVDCVVVGKSVVFNASLSYDPDVGGGITLYMWDFGDGTRLNTTESLINHTYAAEKTRNPVSLTVVDVENSTSRLFYRLIDIVNPKPVARFTVWPPDGHPVVGKSVVFNASLSYDPDVGGGITLYMWDFGDGTRLNTTEPLINHTYLEVTGISARVVRLVVKDAENLTSEPATFSLYVIGSRDVNVKNVEVYPTLVMPGDVVVVNATIASLVTQSAYNFTMGFDVKVFWTDYSEIMQGVIDQKKVELATNVSKIFTFSWNTTGMSEGAYWVWVEALNVPHEDDFTNNIWRSSEAVNVTLREVHDVAIKDLTLAVSVETKEFAPPAIVGENVTMRVYVMANGTVSETFNATLRVMDSEGEVLFSKIWLNEGLAARETKELKCVFNTEDAAAGKYIVSVNVTIAEVDEHPDDNLRSVEFRIIRSPFLLVEPLPSLIVVGDTVVFNASASYHLDGAIVGYRWEFFDPNGFLRRVETSKAVVNFTFPEQGGVGVWVIKLIAEDNYTITYGADRPLTEPYRKVFEVNVKGASVIALQLNPATIQYGQSIIINGTLTPPREGVNVTVRVNGTVLATVLTGDMGNFTITWKPDKAGTYLIEASWPGDAETAPSADEKILIVSKAVSSITLNVSPSTVSVGENVIISGVLSPEEIGAHVNVTVRVNGTVLATVLTGDMGNFTITWKPDKAGTYLIEASWPGDANSLPCSSGQRLVKVEAPQFNVMPYVAVAIVAIIVVALAVYLVKFRKRG
ncbi:MAG: PKD domain-containing protein [Candidatus Bathyarchaeia archaeon]